MAPVPTAARMDAICSDEESEVTQRERAPLLRRRRCEATSEKHRSGFLLVKHKAGSMAPDSGSLRVLITIRKNLLWIMPPRCRLENVT